MFHEQQSGELTILHFFGESKLREKKKKRGAFQIRKLFPQK